MSGTLRLDKWLWQARFFKTRSLATKVVQAGRVRVDGTPVSKPARTIAPGVVLTFPQANEVRVIKVVALGERRGPASEAQALYEDLSPPEAKGENTRSKAPGHDGKGRPSRRDRQKREAFLRDIASCPLADRSSSD